MTWLDDFAAHAVSLLDDRVREALYARGVTDEQVALYGIGYINGRLPELPYSEAFLKETWQGRKLDDCYVFPLTNVLGEVKGFQFRHVERGRTGYTDYIGDKSEAVLFGLAQAMPHVWRTGSAWLVEGNFDLFPIQRHFPGVIATLTARVVDVFVPVLRRLVVGDLFLGYDMDVPGRRGVTNFKKFHGADFNVREVVYPTPVMPVTGKKAKDPGDLWEYFGDEKLGAFVRSVVNNT